MKKEKRWSLAFLLGLILMAGSSAPVMAMNMDADQKASDIQPDHIDYIRGRPMTEDEVREQEAMVPELYEQPAPEDAAEAVLGTEPRAGASYQGVERFDLRSLGLVTSVKNQVTSGPCWAFAAISLAESSMIQQGAAADALDLSEEHLAYFFYERADDPLGNTAADKNRINLPGYDYKTVGGNLQLASKFLSTWSGVADEGVAPYSSASSSLASSLAYESAAHLQRAYFIDASEAEIKNALYTAQQPVGVTYYHGASYYNVDTAAYCYPTAGAGINHAVTIVGWDDSYKKENFLPASKVTSDGAWIVKNSWGGAHGDGGYIYISYEDKSISGAVSAGFEAADSYGHNYQYDGSSGSSAVSVPVGASHANVYQVKGNPSGSEVLKAVGILMKSADADLAVDVYTDLRDPDDPTSGIHAVTGQVVHTGYTGYYTFSLQQDVPLCEGSFFSVIFTNVSDGARSFFIESSSSRDSDWILFEAHAEEGQSFYRSGEGKEWQDMAGGYISGDRSVNTRIKAYTVDSPEVLEPVRWPSVTPTVTPAKDPTPGRAQITKLSLTAKGVRVKWQEASDAVRYEIYRKDPSGDAWKLIKTVSGTSCTDQNVLPATVYAYRVRAVNGTGDLVSCGAYSGAVKILTKPDAPKEIALRRTTKASKTARAKLTFKASADVKTYYIYQYDRRTKKYQAAYKVQGSKLYIYQRAAKKYKKIGSVKSSKNKLSCTLTQIDLKTYNRQIFKIRAYVKKKGLGGRYSGYSGKIMLKR